ncbi:MAG: glycosyltransferase family 2 protein [Candidatus Andersenbacteria bacterium]|nr:glycosyltransferase family 2 protein [Candidatus Andersenbacteria bacterium]
MNKVVVIIVNWNTGGLLAKCVQSLMELPERSHISQIVVIDNASDDRSIVRAQVTVGERGNVPPVNFSKNERNLGFARANNLALARLAERHPSSHVLFINPDTEITPGALTALLAVLENNARAGIVGPKFHSPSGSLQPSVRACPTLGVMVFFFLKLHWLWPRAGWWQRYMQPDFDYTREQTVDQVMGAAMLVRRELLESIGPFDEQFWLWFEEVDLCRRAQAAGWQIIYTPQAQVLHHGAVSFSQLWGVRRAAPWCMSALRYTAKHMGYGAATVLGLLLPAALALAVPATLVHILAQRKGRTAI